MNEDAETTRWYRDIALAVNQLVDWVTGDRRVAQVQVFSTGTVATGTGQIPFDNTIPQNTEGDQFMSLTITPTAIGSTLEIDVSAFAASGVADYITAALFQDSIANALAASTQATFQANAPCILTIKHTVTTTALTATTFKVRIGRINAGTTTFNGSAGGQIYGGAANSRITIKEYLP